MRELRDDRRIEVDVIDLRRREERIDHRLDGARELLEHEVLVLHLGAELRDLEQALAVPFKGGEVGRQTDDGRQQPFVEEGDIARLRRGDHRILGLIDQPIMLGVEDRMHGGEADVLVHATVAGDVMRVEQFVVVFEVLPAA